jgi:hypothetical protein
MISRSWKVLIPSVLFSFITSVAAADPVTFSFTGSQGEATGTGSYGNTRTFTAGGVTMSATAWGYTYGSSDTRFETAALGRWSTGLGSCNRSEGTGSNCSSPQEHQVDNVGADDWVLFVFSAPVDITSVRIDPYGNYDRDVSYWTGNVTGPLNLTGVSYAGLSALGFGSRVDSSASASDAPRDVAIPPVGTFVNALLFGGQLNSDQDDFFKITSLSVNTRTNVPVPEPSTLILLCGGLAMVLARGRTSRGLVGAPAVIATR